MKMRNKSIKHIINILFIIVIILMDFSNCASAVKELDSEEVYNKKLDSDRNKDPVLSFHIYEKKDGTLYGSLTSAFIYGAEFTGEIEENENGDISFYIEEYQAICNWPNGWTEMTYEATGNLVFEYQSNRDSYKINIKYAPEIWDIKNGGIRYFDDYYLDGKGLSKVKDRMLRINAYNDFLKEQDFPEYFGHQTKDTSYGPEFRNTIEDFLFNDSTEYPEQLKDIKEYGTVLRDFEEAYGLMFIQYNMDYFLVKLLPGSIFMEKTE